MNGNKEKKWVVLLLRHHFEACTGTAGRKYIFVQLRVREMLWMNELVFRVGLDGALSNMIQCRMALGSGFGAGSLLKFPSSPNSSVILRFNEWGSEGHSSVPVCPNISTSHTDIASPVPCRLLTMLPPFSFPKESFSLFIIFFFPCHAWFHQHSSVCGFFLTEALQELFFP